MSVVMETVVLATWVLMVVLASVGAVSRKGREGEVDCGTGFLAIAGGCYSFSNESRAWEEAQQDCWAQGAQLVSVLSHQQYTGLMEVINACKEDNSYWTSGAVVRARWVWTAVHQLMVEDWWAAPPFIISKHCAFFYTNYPKISPMPCEDTSLYICERPPARPRDKKDDGGVEEPDDSQEVPKDSTDNSFDDGEDSDDTLVTLSPSNRPRCPHSPTQAYDTYAELECHDGTASIHSVTSTRLLPMLLPLLLWINTL